MLRNYFKVAWRTLRTHRESTIINVGGLAVGMACCLWLLIFVQHEWSYDRFHEDADRLVRINQETVRGDGSVQRGSLVPPPLGPTLEEAVPEAEIAIRLLKREIRILHDGYAEEREVLFADPAFFEVFTFSLINGDLNSALASPNQIVLVESEARRLFGEEDPVGRSLTLESGEEAHDVMVSGVAKDPPATSSIPFSFVMPMENGDLSGVGGALLDSWEMGLTYTFARLRPGANVESLEENLERMLAERFGEDEEAQPYAQAITRAKEKRFYAQPITDIHHATEVNSGLAPTSDRRYVYILGAIAFFVLLIAAINFVTLSLGRSASRAREVGVRKAVGATQTQLGVQFWCEAVLVCVLAFLVGLFIARIFLPVFSDLIQVPLRLAILERPILWVGLAALVLSVGFLTGGYPAWVLARMKVAPVLRGRHSMKARGRLSRMLIAVQFALSVGLVACVFTMSHQLRYMTEGDLGYTDAPIVILQPEVRSDKTQRFSAFKQEAERHPAIHSVGGSGITFGSRGVAPVELQARSGDVVRAYFNLVEPNYVETMGLEVAAGRSFRQGRSSPTLLVNERLVAALGLDNPLGTTLPLRDLNVLTKPLGEAPVVGVVKDYHVSSFEEEIPPLVLLTPPDLLPPGIHTYSARLRVGQTEAGLAALASTWEKVFPEQPFQYAFLQDRIAGQYESERRWRALVGYAALLALLIACFGLFGLAALEVSRRTTEIGIRKVLGASASSLVALLSKDLVRLVILGAVIAVPLAYAAVERWLENFAYRVEPAWWIFIAAGLVALVVALATTSYHTLRAAWMNPTEAIRQE